MRRTAMLLGVLAVGCATSKSARQGPSVFYPPLPNPPRLQYLATFSAAADVGGTRSGFATFIAGEDPKKSLVVQKPYGAAIHDGKIFLSDMKGPGYAVFDLVRHDFARITGSGNGRMRVATNIAVAPDGTKYVADVGLMQVLAFDRDDQFTKAFGVTGQFKPGGVAVSGDRLYVTDLDKHEVEVLSRSSGEVLFKFGKLGDKEGELHFPTNITVGPDGDIYVSDFMNFRIQRFSPDGRFVRSYGSIGDSPSRFARPKGVAVDREGRIYVVDSAFENVQVFDKDGRLLLFFGGPGVDRESINMPSVVLVDYGNVALFQKYADPKFKLEYIVLVASQFGASKLNVFGFGHMEGMDYAEKSPEPAKKM